MTKSVGTVSPVEPSAGRFRPESLSHFKEVAKSMAWLLERPVQKCQEDLARIYGYAGLHELQQVLKKPGKAGPFEPRYGYLGTDEEAVVVSHEQRVFHVLFGARKGYWRENYLASDRCFLVFELGLFQEAAEHRACLEKIRHVFTYGGMVGGWPLVHGWPLGLRSWLASEYAEPYDMAKGWQQVLPRSRYMPMDTADLRWQRRYTGLARLETLFQALAPRITSRKPSGLARVAFDKFEDEAGGLTDSAWEEYCIVEWLGKKEAGGKKPTKQQLDAVKAFVRRPSKRTAEACEYARKLTDPAGFRDRWAFESYKASLDNYLSGEKAAFASSLDEGAIHSLVLAMDSEGANISEWYYCQLWQLHCTWSEVTEPATPGGMPVLQPRIHANGSLIVPCNGDLVVMSASDWYLSHDASDFASEAAAVTFEKVYLPAIGVRKLDFTRESDPSSVIEIDELLLAPGVSSGTLRAYFTRLLNAFDDSGNLPDSYGSWSNTLSLTFEDEDENGERNENGEYAYYVSAPSVLLINVDGCGLTAVEAQHRNGKPVSILRSKAKATPSPDRRALAALVLEATKGLDVDVVVYDGELWTDSSPEPAAHE